MPSVRMHSEACLFCLKHPMGKECWTMVKWPYCTIDCCGKPHHEMLHEVLKAGNLRCRQRRRSHRADRRRRRAESRPRRCI